MKLNKEKIAALSFSLFSKIGFKKISTLLLFFKSLDNIYQASFTDLKRAGLEDSLTCEFLAWKAGFNLSPVLELLTKEEISFCYFYEPEYPKILKEIYNPPLVIYYKGNLSFDEALSLSVVGSREHSPYGATVVSRMVKLACDYKLVIISGLAIGIDSLAHTKALDCGGKTIAVLGSGLDKNNIYPRNNIYLFNRIIESGGAVISEFPPGTPPLRQNFPQRNRIIAGLARATLVIEAKEKSGSLITAYQALEQGREVMSIPGSIFSDFSSGTNQLISKGAKIIRNEMDILDFFYENLQQ